MARAVAEALEARNERDNAVEAQHKSQLEGQAWKQEVINYKASVRILLPAYMHLINLVHVVEASRNISELPLIVRKTHLPKSH